MYWDNSVKHFEADENVFNKYETFSDVPPPTTTSRPTTGSGAVSTGYNVCFVDLMYTMHTIYFTISVKTQDDGPSKYVQILTLPKGQQDCTCYKSKIYSQLRLEL